MIELQAISFQKCRIIWHLEMKVFFCEKREIFSLLNLRDVREERCWLLFAQYMLIRFDAICIQ
jgi:hypothetical protein